MSGLCQILEICFADSKSSMGSVKMNECNGFFKEKQWLASVDRLEGGLSLEVGNCLVSWGHHELSCEGRGEVGEKLELPHQKGL